MSEPSPHPVEPSSGRILFDEFELRLDTCELTRGGRPVKLQRQPARLLALLALRSGEALHRDEIRRELWGEDTFVEAEPALNFAIRQLRRALGDTATEPRFVETLPRFGYRFLLPIRRGDEGKEEKSPSDEGEREESPKLKLFSVVGRWRRQARWVTAALTVLLVGILILGGFFAGRGQSLRSERPNPPIPRLLVLPFVTQAESGADRELADGLTEDLIGELARLDPARLAVLAHESARSGNDRRRSPREVGTALGADYLLLGTLRRAGDRAHVTLELVRSASGDRAWGGTVEEPLADFAQLPRRLGEEVGRALRIPPRSRLQRRPPVAPAAYEAYLEGIYRARRAGWIGHDPRAVTALERATELAPDFAPAWGELALARLDFFTGPTVGFAVGVEGAARRALRLDPENATAHRALGDLALFGWFDLRRAGAEMESALAADPGSADAHHGYADFLAAAGRLDEAIAEVKRARGLDPAGMAVQSDLVWYYYLARQYDAALAEARLAARLDPVFPSRVYWIFSYMMKKDEKAALRQAQIWVDLLADLRHRPVSPRLTGLHDFWAGRLAKLDEIRRTAVLPPTDLALHALALGDRNRALELLAEACDRHFGYLLPFFSSDPLADPLRGDPRFARILRCAGH